jgi:hypothetical protein
LNRYFVIKEAAMFRLYGPAVRRRLGSVVVCGLSAAVLGALVVSAQTAPAGQTPAGQAPAGQAPAAAAPAQPTAPPQQKFGPDAGLVLHFIKPDKTADFEMVMAKVKEVLLKSDKPERKQQAIGWKLFKSPEAAGGNALYVFVIDPALKGADYSPSNILAEGLPPAEVNTLYEKYAGSYATGQNPVNLQLVNDFGK